MYVDYGPDTTYIYNCSICGREVKTSQVKECIICKKRLCTSCMEYRFCVNHLTNITSEGMNALTQLKISIDRKKRKTSIITYIFFFFFIAIFISVTIYDSIWMAGKGITRDNTWLLHWIISVVILILLVGIVLYISINHDDKLESKFKEQILKIYNENIVHDSIK